MLRPWLELYMLIKWHNGSSQWARATAHKSPPVFPNLTMAWTILCSGAVGRRPPFDEWVRRSIHSFLVAANEMRDRVCDWYRPWRHMGTSGPFLCSAAMRLWHHEERWKRNEAPSCLWKEPPWHLAREEKGLGDLSGTGRWVCWAAGEHFLPAGSRFTLVTLFCLHGVNRWWIGN